MQIKDEVKEMLEEIVNLGIEKGYEFLYYDGRKLDWLSLEYKTGDLHERDYVDIDITKELKDNETIHILSTSDLFGNHEFMRKLLGEEIKVYSTGLCDHMCGKTVRVFDKTCKACSNYTTAFQYHITEVFKLASQEDRINYVYEVMKND